MSQIDLREVYYRVIAYPKEKTPVEITSLCETIKHSESEDRFVADLQIKLKNVKEQDHGWIHSQVKVTTPIILQAKEGHGGKWTTIFKGMVYKWKTNASDHTINLLAFDDLYPILQSEEHYYFKENETAKSCIETIAKDKGIKLRPIAGLDTKLEKKIATGGLHDTIKERVEAHNKKSPKKYIVRAAIGNYNMEVVERGGNKTIYEITDWSIAESSHEVSIEDLVTVVKVYGKSENDKRPPVKATHKRNTELGEIVRVIEADDKKDESAKEAKEILDEHSKPKNKLLIDRTVDIPWVRKGDKIRVATGTAGSYKNGKQVAVSYIIKSVSRDIDSRTMRLELEV